MAVVCLYRRDHGVHTLLKAFKTRHRVVEKLTVNEDRLIGSLPDGWLPVPPARCLLTVARNRHGSDGQVGLKRFLNWSKYFPSYVVTVIPSAVYRSLGSDVRQTYESLVSGRGRLLVRR